MHAWVKCSVINKKKFEGSSNMKMNATIFSKKLVKQNGVPL